MMNVSLFLKIAALFLALLGTRPVFAERVILETFAEVTGMYIGSCEALNYLKTTSCPHITLIKQPAVCVEDSYKLMLIRYRTELEAAIKSNYSKLSALAKQSAAVGLETTVNGAGGNKVKGCEIYVATLNAWSHSKFEELTRLGKILEKLDK